jgi:hypothetical protein
MTENDRYLEGELFLEEFKVVLRPKSSYNLRSRAQENDAAFVDSLWFQLGFVTKTIYAICKRFIMSPANDLKHLRVNILSRASIA